MKKTTIKAIKTFNSIATETLTTFRTAAITTMLIAVMFLVVYLTYVLLLYIPALTPEDIIKLISGLIKIFS